MSILKNAETRKELLNRLRRAEGQLRGLQRMLEEEEDCLKIAQQFSAVRKALESTYLRMTMCFVAQKMEVHAQSLEVNEAQTSELLKEMETMLQRIA